MVIHYHLLQSMWFLQNQHSLIENRNDSIFNILNVYEGEKSLPEMYRLILLFFLLRVWQF